MFERRHSASIEAPRIVQGRIDSEKAAWAIAMASPAG
jgi:hypothetical protein